MLSLEPLFQGFSTPLLLLVICTALAVLAKAADRLVESASALAEGLGMPSVIVGATIVALGTTMPEFAVSVLAAWSGKAGLALGNAVGSVLADTGLIFGLCALLAPLPANRFLLMRQGRVQLGAGLLLALFCYVSFAVSGPAATLGRASGLVLLALLLVYMRVSISWSRSYQAEECRHHTLGSVGGFSWRSATTAAAIVAGLAVLAVSSDILIDAVTVFALRLGVPQVVIAATLVAFGTSLPELIVGITAVRKGQLELVVGNIIGADILNVLFVIGASALAVPLPLIDPAAQPPELFLVLHLPAMILVLAAFRVFTLLAVGPGKFSRWMGLALLVIYLSYVMIQSVPGIV